jgi:hypothetical protein
MGTFILMKKTLKILLLFTTFIAASAVCSQNFEWAKAAGGGGLDYGRTVSVDGDGNVYTIGYFYGTVDFDPGNGIHDLAAVGSYDIFIQKLSSNGDFIWAKSIGGTAIDYGLSIVADDEGNIYTTGHFQGVVDFDPGLGVFNLTSKGDFDLFVLKLDSSGNFAWVKSMGGNDTDNSQSIALDDYGHVYITGHFKDTVDFDPSSNVVQLISKGTYDIFIQKLDTSGTFIWAKSLGGIAQDIGLLISIDPQGNAYITGYFQGMADFDPGLGTHNMIASGARDIYVLKLDSSGNFAWAKAMGGSGHDYGSSLTVDGKGNVYTTGYFQGSADFDPSNNSSVLTSVGNNDVFIQKMDTAGRFIWAKSFGSSSVDFGSSITSDTAGNVYTTGYYQNTVDFDPGIGTYNLTSAGNYDVFVQKLDSSGALVWASSFGGNGQELGQCIAVDKKGRVYTTGYFSGTPDFDPGTGRHNISGAGSLDVFVHKMNQCQVNTRTDTIQACEQYTWINGKTYTQSSDTAQWIISNYDGCDSIITLKLTINKVNDLSTTVNNSTITANNSNATYVWLNCDKNYSPIAGETSQSFTPTSNGNYAVELTENDCVDTSACVRIANLDITDLLFESGIKLYPNPSSGKIWVDLGKVYPSAEIVISNSKGKILLSETLIAKKVWTIELNEPSGIYLISIRVNNKVVNLRFAKYP